MSSCRIAQWRPGLYCDVVGLAVCLGCIIVSEYIELDLIHRGTNLELQAFKMFRPPVAHADGSQDSSCMVLLQHLPCVITATKRTGQARCVDQHEIQVACLKLLQVILHKISCCSFAKAGRDLRSDEEIFSLCTSSLQDGGNFCLIEINIGSVNSTATQVQPVANDCRDVEINLLGAFSPGPDGNHWHLNSRSNLFGRNRQFGSTWQDEQQLDQH
mmetsp:Transcript_97935/g.174381  ORF Transcript_97935/g.174381 Transcript_97935/m.174381 type:complete len:215 (+) Transcript_97935:281-925(+)